MHFLSPHAWDSHQGSWTRAGTFCGWLQKWGLVSNLRVPREMGQRDDLCERVDPPQGPAFRSGD
jgi:hypothetical protein